SRSAREIGMCAGGPVGGGPGVDGVLGGVGVCGVWWCSLCVAVVCLPASVRLLSESFLLAACIVTPDQSMEADPKDPRAQDIVDKVRSIDLQPRQTGEAGGGGMSQSKSSNPAIYLSDGTAPQGGALAERDDGGSSGYDLNFENA